MYLSQFNFNLPKDRIAHYPLPDRTASRLLCLNKTTGKFTDAHFVDLLNLLSSKDLLVFNDTRVIPARWFGKKISGGRIEVLLERVLSQYSFLAHVRAGKSLKTGSQLYMDGDVILTVKNRKDTLFELECVGEQSVLTLLKTYGHIPLPHYMERNDEILDSTRYQTVYAKREGAVAAPTAGLHFDEAMLAAVTAKGVEKAFVTLHIGAGTFQPVREENIENHQMHSEYLEISEEVCHQVKATKARGGRVIAVGTTSVRVLETASQSGEITPYLGDTRLFIYPGYTFQIVDALITNFHLPKSSLLMLVCALGGYHSVMESYHHAISSGYRFFSYGDAMWIS